MIEGAGYHLIVTCDGINHIARDVQGEVGGIVQTLAEAKLVLRKRGWIFKKDGKTFCNKTCASNFYLELSKQKDRRKLVPVLMTTNAGTRIYCMPKMAPLGEPDRRKPEESK